MGIWAAFMEIVLLLYSTFCGHQQKLSTNWTCFHIRIQNFKKSVNNDHVLVEESEKIYMAQYVQIPPTVEAVQWDGTLEGALLIQEMLIAEGRRRSFHIKTFYYGEAAGFRQRDYLEFEGPIPGSQDRDDKQFYSGSWLVRFPDGHLESMSDEKFKREFKKAHNIFADSDVSS